MQPSARPCCSPHNPQLEHRGRALHASRPQQAQDMSASVEYQRGGLKGGGLPDGRPSRAHVPGEPAQRFTNVRAGGGEE
eukprot:1909765-Pleurochrysis_carterae.AAC.1